MAEDSGPRGSSASQKQTEAQKERLENLITNTANEQADRTGAIQADLGGRPDVGFTDEEIAAAMERGESLGVSVPGETTFDPTRDVESIDPTNKDAVADLERVARTEQLRDLAELLNVKFEDLEGLIDTETARREEAGAQAGDFMTQFSDLLGQSTTAGATDEQIERIAQVAEAQLARGQSDIENSLQRTLDQLAEESGASRGLRFTDTPIFDDAQQVGAEALRQQAQLSEAVRGSQAQAELDIPILERQMALQGANAAMGAQQFQEQLAQQAFQNRLALFGETAGFGLDLLGTSPSAQDFILGLRGTRDTTPKGPSRTDQLIGAGTTLAAAAIMSDERLKQNIEEMSVEELADKFEQLPMSTWEYIEMAQQGNERHLGSMAQDLKRVFGIGDGREIKPVDMLGVVTAAAKVAAAAYKQQEA